MGKIEIFEEQKLRKFTWAGPNYYDYPDGEDLIGKLKFTTLVATTTGIITGSIVASTIPDKSKTIKTKLFRTAQFVVPCLGVAVLFTTITYFSTKLRKKDDEINYVIGGLISGSSLAVTTPFPQLGVAAALTFALGGYIKKYHQLAGKKMITQAHKNYFSSYFLRNWDTSLVEKRTGNWTRDPPK